MDPAQAEEARKKRQEEMKRKREAGPTRTGRKKKKGIDQKSDKLPQITPNQKCRLRLLRQERVKDYILLEQEFIQNQERLKPIDETRKAEQATVDKKRKLPLNIATLEEMIDDDHVIVAPH